MPSYPAVDISRQNRLRRKRAEQARSITDKRKIALQRPGGMAAAGEQARLNVGRAAANLNPAVASPTPSGPATPWQPERMQSIVERGAGRPGTIGMQYDDAGKPVMVPTGEGAVPADPTSQYGRAKEAGSLAPGGTVTERGTYVGPGSTGDPNYGAGLPWYQRQPEGGGPSYAGQAHMLRNRAELGQGRQAVAQGMPSPDAFLRQGMGRQQMGAYTEALPGQLEAEQRRTEAETGRMEAETGAREAQTEFVRGLMNQPPAQQAANLGKMIEQFEGYPEIQQFLAQAAKNILGVRENPGFWDYMNALGMWMADQMGVGDTLREWEKSARGAAGQQGQ